MIRALCLAIALLAVSPATAAVPAPPTGQQALNKIATAMQNVTIPVDPIARKKFPHVDGKLIDELAFINKLVNASITYESDEKHYGVDDFWVMAPADGKGDCEDFSETKFFLIEEVGDDPSSPLTVIGSVENMKFVSVHIHYIDSTTHGKWAIDGHSILAVQLPNGQVAYLDLNYAEPMTRAELAKNGGGGIRNVYYTFFDWRA